MKDFRLPMFNNQAKLIQDRRNNVITTKEKRVGFFKRFFLINEKSIIYRFRFICLLVNFPMKYLLEKFFLHPLP